MNCSSNLFVHSNMCLGLTLFQGQGAVSVCTVFLLARCCQAVLGKTQAWLVSVCQCHFSWKQLSWDSLFVRVLCQAVFQMVEKVVLREGFVFPNGFGMWRAVVSLL